MRNNRQNKNSILFIFYSIAFSKFLGELFYSIFRVQLISVKLRWFYRLLVDPRI